MQSSAAESMFTIKCRFQLLYVVAVALLSFVVAATADVNTADVVQGVLARTEALVSGQLHYTIESGFSNQDDGSYSQEYRLVFQGSSWRLTGLGPTVHREKVSHAAKTVEYQREPQPDGTTSASARVDDKSLLLNENQPYHPTCAGTIWFAQTIDYITNHHEMVQYKGRETINNVACIVLEWNISHEDRYKAFSTINALNHEGGTLRIFVAPQLGYALPRIEHLSPDGTVSTYFDSTDFKEYGGVFLPRTSRYQLISPGGTPGFFVEHRISEITDVNESIAAEEFAVSVPDGTTIADQRGQDGAKIFEAYSGMIPEDIADILVAGETNRPSRSRAIYVGLFIGAIFLVVLFGVRKSWHRQQAG